MVEMSHAESEYGLQVDHIPTTLSVSEPLSNDGKAESMSFVLGSGVIVILTTGPLMQKSMRMEGPPFPTNG